MPHRKGNSPRQQPLEDGLIRHVMRKRGVSKGRAIQFLKGSGQLKQSGGHVSLTSRGREAAKKARGQPRDGQISAAGRRRRS